MKPLGFRDYIAIAILFGLGILSGWLMAKQNPYLPSQSDIQRELVSRGYDIGPKGIDGKIGKDSRLAWDRAYCDERGIKAYKRVFFGENQKDKYKIQKDLRPIK